MRSVPADAGARQLPIARRKRQLPHLHPVKQPPQHVHDLGDGYRSASASSVPTSAAAMPACSRRASRSGRRAPTPSSGRVDSSAGRLPLPEGRLMVSTVQAAGRPPSPPGSTSRASRRPPRSDNSETATFVSAHIAGGRQRHSRHGPQIAHSAHLPSVECLAACELRLAPLLPVEGECESICRERVDDIGFGVDRGAEVTAWPPRQAR
jgi:hypothetical protein